MDERTKFKTMAVVLGTALLLALGFLAHTFWQNYWWRVSVDLVADQAGVSQAMSTFRRGRLVLWELHPTNDFPRFSGRYDGPFQIWLAEYHSMPEPWQYSQRRLFDAHNRQMRYMYEHPDKFKPEALTTSETKNGEKQ